MFSDLQAPPLSAAAVNGPFAGELVALRAALQRHGLHATLKILNLRTPFRFTGVYRYDGATLRNIALYDRWEPTGHNGSDAPMADTYCAIVGRNGALEVADGRQDARFPWMHGNLVVSYCGAPIRAPDGSCIGTLCHFDLKPCQATQRELPLIQEAAALFYPWVARAREVHAA